MAKDMRKGRTDWARLARLSDSDIRTAVRTDRDAAPIASADWLRRAQLMEPKPKKAVSIRLDEDVLDWFSPLFSHTVGLGWDERSGAAGG